MKGARLASTQAASIKMKATKLISMLMIIALALSVIPYSATAEEENSIDILVLGDSIALGTNSSYCAGQLAANCTDSNCTVLARDGMKTTNLLIQLSSIKAKVKSAKNIVISIGGNDFLDPIMALIDSYRTEGEPISAAVENMKKDAVNVMKKYKETVPTQLQPALKNIGDIAKKIRSLNTTAKVMFLNMYNPVEALVKEDTMFDILNSQFKTFVADFNSGLAAVEGITVLPLFEKFEGNNSIYTNSLYYYKTFNDYDIHPSDEGQLLIAALIKSEITGTPLDEAKAQVIMLNYSDREISRLPAPLKEGLNLTRKKGDANDDGVIDAADAALVLKYSVGKTDPGRLDMNNTDVNKDKDTDTCDATLILKYDAKIITSF